MAGSVQIHGPVSARDLLGQIARSEITASTVVLDPWYGRKTAPGRAAFLAEALPLLDAAAAVGQHVFVWGWPESLARLIDHLPPPLRLEAWLTWYYRNVQSRARGWRPAQQACLHLRRPGASIYPEHFYKESHQAHARANRLEFKMGPQTVLQEALLSGFIKRTEQTGFRPQKPVSVIEPLIRMTTQRGDLVIDPTAGSGTTGMAAVNLQCAVILGDRSSRAIKVSRARLKDYLQPTMSDA